MNPLRRTERRCRDEWVYVWLCPVCSNEFEASRQKIRNTSKRGGVPHCGCDTQRRQSVIKLGTEPANKMDDLTRSVSALHTTRGMVMEIAPERVAQLITQGCHYCGTAPNQYRALGQGRWKRLSSVATHGLDRKDSGRGYSEDNVVTCCLRCNMVKRDMPYSEFIDMCKDIARNHE